LNTKGNGFLDQEVWRFMILKLVSFRKLTFFESIKMIFGKMKRIAIFASGSGSNAQRIVEYFANHPSIKIELILSNNQNAYVLERAKKLNIPSIVFNREELKSNTGIVSFLKQKKIDLIVLAGFLWLIPSSLIAVFSKKIVNIHPALLPKYGGKNMYGMNVHETVIAAGETESGITIHWVDEFYDNGKIIFQAKCNIQENDTAEMLADKIHALEYAHFPKVIEKLLKE